MTEAADTIKLLEPPKPGIHDMPAATYHLTKAINAGAVCKGGGKTKRDGSPAHMHYALTHTDDRTSKPLTIGGAAHCILESLGKGEDLVADRYITWSGAKRNTKAGKEEFAAISSDAEALGKEIISDPEMDTAKILAAQIRAFLPARRLMESPGAQWEKSWFWQCPYTGLMCKARPDLYVPYKVEGRVHHVIADFKNCDNACHRDFTRAVGNYRWMLRAVHYCIGGKQVLKPNTGEDVIYRWIASEKQVGPGCCNIYGPDIANRTFEETRKKYQAIMEEYAECLKAGVFVGYHSKACPVIDVDQIELPPWAR